MEFLNMGGYGAYVWSAYGITFVVMIIAIVIPLRQHATLRKRLTSQLKRKNQS
ncbi:MAG: heme exporter protein CcmD [Gammaproteobacteria bacterium]